MKDPLRFRAALLLAGIWGMIVYGSLYPFDFAAIQYPGGAVHALLSTWPERTTLGDMLANILLYMPLGFCAVLCLRGPRLRRALLSIAGGIALSAVMEFLQLFDDSRWATMSDVRSNAIGALIGSVAGLALEPFWNSRRGQPMRNQPFVFLLLGCWSGYRFFPYVPVIDLHKYWHAMQPLLRPQFSIAALLRHTSAWLAIAGLLEALWGASATREALCLLLPAALLSRILIMHLVLSPSEVVGGILAIVLWTCWLWQAPGRMRWIAACFALSVLVQGLEPFRLAHHAQRFSWIPFYGLLEGEPQIAVPVFFEKTFVYGTLLWLLRACGFNERAAVLSGGALIAVLTAIHLYLPGRSAEPTDLLLFLSMWLLMRWTGARFAVSNRDDGMDSGNRPQALPPL